MKKLPLTPQNRWRVRITMTREGAGTTFYVSPPQFIHEEEIDAPTREIAVARVVRHLPRDGSIIDVEVVAVS
jgi:hypothetical protein